MSTKKEFGDKNKLNSKDRKAEALRANLLRRKQYIAKQKDKQKMLIEEENNG